MPGPRTAELNGLNWQVQVDPLTLSMTSLPPTLVPLAAVEEPPELVELLELLELPPHAATATATDTPINKVSQLMRFIDILRSPSKFASRSLAQSLSSPKPLLETTYGGGDARVIGVAAYRG